MNFILLYGLPGVGKRTVGDQIAEKLGYKFIQNHDLLDFVRRFLPEKKDYSICLDICKNLRELLLLGFINADEKGVVNTTAGGSPGALERISSWVNLAEDHGAKIFLVELVADLNSIRKRIEEPDRKKWHKITKQSEFDEFLQKDYFKGIPGRESLIIDNTNMPPEECANLIIEKLGL